MAKVYVDTENMTKDQIIELALDKDKVIARLETEKEALTKVYEAHRVGDTYQIHVENEKQFVTDIERVFRDIKSGVYKNG